MEETIMTSTKRKSLPAGRVRHSPTKGTTGKCKQCKVRYTWPKPRLIGGREGVRCPKCRHVLQRTNAKSELPTKQLHQPSPTTGGRKWTRRGPTGQMYGIIACANPGQTILYVFTVRKDFEAAVTAHEKTFGFERVDFSRAALGPRQFTTYSTRQPFTFAFSGATSNQ
jgi:DNA-directed RNA polymerase subunit RPC12/RpoP